MKFYSKAGLLIVLICLFFTSCQPLPPPVQELTVEQAIQHFHVNPYRLADELQFEKGDRLLSNAELGEEDIASYGYDYGLNAAGEVALIRLREKNYHDNLLKIIIAHYDSFPVFLEILPPRYDCDSLGPVLDLIYDTDQGIYNSRIDYKMSLGMVNDARAFSILTACDFSTLQQYSLLQRAGLFLTIQHSEADLQVFYYPYFVRAVEAGVFPRSQLALLTDRLLLRYDYPQVFGSQINKENNQLFELMYPESVDSLRAEMGLDSLVNYVAYFQGR